MHYIFIYVFIQKIIVYNNKPTIFYNILLELSLSYGNENVKKPSVRVEISKRTYRDFKNVIYYAFTLTISFTILGLVFTIP